jgi:hypothetical protein
LEPGTKVFETEFETGRYRLVVQADRPGASVLVKSSYHRNWRVTAKAGNRLDMDESGLMRLRDIGVGRSEIEIDYRPAAWPTWLSVCGWVGILAVLTAPRRRPG